MNSMTMSAPHQADTLNKPRGVQAYKRKSCPWVSFSWSMETVGEPDGFYPKLLKWKHFVPSVPKSLGPQALRKIRSLEHFSAICPPTRSTAAALKHRRCWAFPTRHLGLRIVAIEEIGGGLETEIQRSPNFRRFHCLPNAHSKYREMAARRSAIWRESRIDYRGGARQARGTAKNGCVARDSLVPIRSTLTGVPSGWLDYGA